MREIGFIKWFGGYDRQRGRENDFGYIGREGRTDDIKVYREEVHCSESSLIEGTSVTFELVINLQTNKQFATNLNFMNTAKLTTDGTHQIVILPEEFQLTGTEVYIKKIGNAIVLIAKDNRWESLIDSLDNFSDDFMNSRDQPVIDTRESF